MKFTETYRNIFLKNQFESELTQYHKNITQDILGPGEERQHCLTGDPSDSSVYSFTFILLLLKYISIYLTTKI